MDNKVNSESYITIQGWMITDLKLSGNDLLVYAIIYGFSQDSESAFYGSRQYLADWCNSTVRGIQKNINNLIELGLIEQVESKAGSYVKYKANRVGTKFTGEQSSLVPVNKVHTPGEQSSRYNIDNTIELEDSNTILKDSTAKKRSPIINNSNTFNMPKRNIVLMDSVNDKAYGNEKEEKQKEKKLNMYQKCILEIDNYTADETLKQALKDYLSIRLKITGDKRLLGVSQWKGMLNKLSILKGDKVAIVKEATANGWAGFFEPKNSKWNNKPNKAIFGEAENMKTVRPEEVEGGEFSGQIF